MNKMDRTMHKKKKIILGSSLKKLLLKFTKDNQGVTTIEYGLIAAGIAGVLITIIGTLGTSTKDLYTNLETQL